MAINYPGSLDDFTNPAAGNTLDSPSHSGQHSDLNDAVEALEAKVGIGASPAGSATAGQVLTAQGGGTAIWDNLPADTSGLIHINTTAFSASASESFNNVFNATYKNYLVILTLTNSTSTSLNWRVRASGTDLSSSTYRLASIRQDPATYATNVFGVNTGTQFSSADAKTGNVVYVRFGLPFETTNTQFLIEGDGVSYRNVRGGGFVDDTTSYDGFTVYPGSGTMTGNIQIFGYKE